MAAPTFSETNAIKVRNGTLTNDRWSVKYGDPVSIRVVCASSGNSSPYVRITASWGDDSTETLPDVAVGQEVQLDHVYEVSGDYSIAVVATNKAGEQSTLLTAPVRVEQLEARKKSLYRWRGIALPRTTLRLAVAAVAEDYPAMQYTVSVAAQAGARELFVYAGSISVPEAEFTVSQPGKFHSSGRVIGSSLNKLILDTALADSYDAEKASVELHVRSLSNTAAVARTTDHQWLFEPSTDEELVRSSFIMNLIVRKGERVMLPEFGSDLPEIPFEQNDIITRQLLMLETAEPIARWEPRATITNIALKSNGDESTADIAYRFAGSSADTTFSALIPLSMPSL